MTGTATPLRPWAGRVLLAASVLLLAGCSGEYPQTTFRPVTEFGEVINELFYNTTAWTMGILLIVESVLLYILFRFRARPDSPEPKQIHGNTVVEIIWTVIPAVIVALIAIPAVSVLFHLQRPMDEGAFEVNVIGHQWWWEFQYPELPGVITANEMHVPVGRTIYLNMRSNDVIHSFWIPRIGGKRDVNPVPAIREDETERLNHLQFTINQAGVYDGQCAEYCGLAHAIMRMQVIAHEPEQFDQWVAAYLAPKPVPIDPLAAHGQQVFSRTSCIACHSVAGTNFVGRIGPNLTFMGDRWTVGAGVEETSMESLMAWITNPHALKPGARMPGIRTEGGGMPPTGLSEEDVHAVAAYLLSLRSDAVPTPAGDSIDGGGVDVDIPTAEVLPAGAPATQGDAGRSGAASTASPPHAGH